MEETNQNDTATRIEKKTCMTLASLSLLFCKYKKNVFEINWKALTSAVGKLEKRLQIDRFSGDSIETANRESQSL